MFYDSPVKIYCYNHKKYVVLIVDNYLSIKTTYNIRMFSKDLSFRTHRIVQEILISQSDAVFQFGAVFPTQFLGFAYIQ